MPTPGWLIAAAIAAAPAPAPKDDGATRWRRSGVLFAGQAGALACTRPWCDGFSAGGYGGLEIGYRHRFVAPVLALSGGGGPAKVPQFWRDAGWDPAKRAMTFLDVGIGVLLFPVARGRVDPYLGARIGGSFFASTLRYTGGGLLAGLTVRERIRRAGVRIVAGLDVYAARRLAIGPRFEITVPFGGEICVSGEAPGVSSHTECTKVSERDSSEDLPLSFAFAVNVRFVLPVRDHARRAAKPVARRANLGTPMR
jgi:hypothetical protein